MAKGTLNDPVRISKRIRKFTSRDYSRPILCGIHLDECGDVVATDSYRMYIEHGAWDGPSIDLPAETLAELAKRKLKGNDTATIAYDTGGEIVKTELSGGERFCDSRPGGKYPNYKMLCGGKVNTIAYVKTKELLPIVREHVKLNQPVLIDVTERDLRVRGVGEEPLPEYRVEKACDGIDNEVTLNATFLRDALSVCGEVAEIRIESHIRAVAIVDGSIEIIVMPVRMTPTKATTKKAERKPEPEKVDVRELKMALYAMAVDRAAEDADSRMRGGNASEKERSLVWRLQKDGRLDHETFGNYTAWKLDGEFVTCIERRWSKRKIHLHYPELKPLGHDENIVAKLAAEELKREKFAKAFAEKCDEKTGIKLDVKPIPGGGYAAGFKQEPKKEETDMTDELKARIEELEAQLKARNEELEAVWKENESLKRSKPEPKAEAPKPEPAKAEHETVAEVSLSAMQEWCEGKGLIATQKREGACIWVEGDSKPYADELKELGFRFAKKRKSWYFTAA